MARNANTKQSGKSPGTGEDKAAIIRKAQQLLRDTILNDRVVGNPQIELPVGKNFVVRTTVPMTLIIYQGHDEGSLGTAFRSFLNDTAKLFTPPDATDGTPAEGVARRPFISRPAGGGKRIGKKITCLLPERYPVTEIGGNMGSVDGGERARKGRQSIIVRIPPTVPLISWGLFLYALNASAPKTDRQIIEYRGPSGTVTYAAPVTVAEKTEQEAGLAKMVEVA